MEYTELREKYQNFYYHAYTVFETEKNIRICYAFSIEGLEEFHPEWIIPKPAKETIGNYRSLREAAFSLGLVELISYWKLTCSPHVWIQCGTLNDAQKQWWKKLYFNGLGEFFYRNQIEADLSTFMDLRTTGMKIDGDQDMREFAGNLIPVGGGKDSFVTMDLLQEEMQKNHVFVINAVASAVHSAQAAGYDGDRLILAKRTLDPAMLELNRQGYLNGHTPFSALAAFASTLTALVYCKRYVILSNEASADEATVKDSTVNHQYSKTFAFEGDFDAYFQTYISKKVFYFSLLRPLSELQITGMFSRLKSFHNVFRSCNVGQKDEIWCGHCAKCLFVYIMLSAFLTDTELCKIFGTDMLNDRSMLPLFEQLSGIQDNKPFECVGTRDEVNTAICMSIRRHQKAGMTLPYLYQLYSRTSYYAAYRERQVQYIKGNEKHHLPEHFQALLRRRLKEMEEYA